MSTFGQSVMFLFLFVLFVFVVLEVVTCVVHDDHECFFVFSDGCVSVDGYYVYHV